MKRTPENLAICTVLFAVSLVISNVTASKLFVTGFSVMGQDVLVPCAVFCYAVTFLMTDVIGELWGKAEANRAVFLGFVGQVFAAVLLTAAGALPAADPEVGAAYSRVLGQSWIFTAGSLAAYFASQYWDVCVFHAMRDRMMRANASRSLRWVWNNASTMTSQMIDTVIFIGVSFGLGFGWLFSPEMRGALAAMMLGQYVVKFALAAADTPIFMFLTRERRAEPKNASA